MADDDFNLFSQSSINTVRIQNNTGENNCYVNVLIHSAFYLEEFSNAILNCDLTKIQPKMNIFIEFQKVLQQYIKIRFDSSDSCLMLDPTAFKIELAELFKPHQQYQLNDQGDPIELLIFLFNAFHSFQVNPLMNPIEVKDEICNPKCFIHNQFYLKLVENNTCSQCMTNRKINYDNNYFIYELYVIDVFRLIKMNKINLKNINQKLFDYSKIITKQTDVHCEKHSSELITKSLICELSSKYLLINLVWNSMNPNVDLIDIVFNMIALNIINSDLFEVKQKSAVKTYQLSGIIVYWNIHYVCAFCDNGIWLLYDDKKIDQFESWEMLIKYLVCNHYQPISLFYTEEKSIANVIQCDNIVPIKQDQLIPNDYISPVMQSNEEIDPSPSIKSNQIRERNKKININHSEFFKRSQVKDKTKNVITKKLVLTNTTKEENINNSKEVKKPLINIPEVVQRRNTKEINCKTETGEYIICEFCHEENKKYKKKCQCGTNLQSNETQTQLYLNQEINENNIHQKNEKEENKKKNYDNQDNCNQINNTNIQNLNIKKIKIIK